MKFDNMQAFSLFPPSKMNNRIIDPLKD